MTQQTDVTTTRDPLPQNVPLISTEIAGPDPELHIRGRSLYDLAERCSLPDLHALLFYGELPSAELSADLQCRVAETADIDPSVQERVAGLPWHLSLLEALRFALLELNHFNEHRDDSGVEASIDFCLRTQTQLMQLLANRYCSNQGVPLPPAPADLDYVDQFLLQFRGVPAEPLERQVVTVISLLFATDPECPSDVAARAVAAGGGDLGTALLAASSASRVEEIGRTAEKVFEFLDEIECEADVETLLERLSAGEQRLPGVVPGASAGDDPREEILSGYCLSLADDREQAGFERLVTQIEQVVPDVQLTVAWPLARIFHYLGLEHELIAPLLTIARFPGWTAHFLEQLGHPLDCGWRYIGPEFRPVEGEDSQL